MRLRQVFSLIKRTKSLPLKPILSILLPLAKRVIGEDKLEQQIESLNTTKVALQQLVAILKVIIGILSLGVILFISVLIYSLAT